MKKLAVLIDFTSVCEIAIEHAAVIVRHTLSTLILVNIADPSQKEKEKDIKEKMRSHAQLLDQEGIPYILKVGYGEFFSTIPEFLTKTGADFVVVGTHGIKGIADASYGLNIIRLIQSLSQPTLIVQSHSEAPHEGYDSILIPNILNKEPINQIEVIKEFSKKFESRITILDFINNEGTTGEKETNYKKQCQQVGLSIEYDYEVVSQFEHFYSRSISQYADIEDMNLIIWTNPPGKEMFDDADKENLILNRAGIPVWHIPHKI